MLRWLRRLLGKKEAWEEDSEPPRVRKRKKKVERKEKKKEVDVMTLTGELKELLAQIQVAKDQAQAKLEQLEVAVSAVVGVSQVPAAEPKAPAVKLAKKPDTPRDPIVDVAIAIARGNSKKEVRTEQVVELLKQNCQLPDVQKPGAVVGLKLSKAPGFERVGLGVYTYHPGKSGERAPRKAKVEAPPPEPSGNAGGSGEDVCGGCGNPVPECICQRVQGALSKTFGD